MSETDSTYLQRRSDVTCRRALTDSKNSRSGSVSTNPTRTESMALLGSARPRLVFQLVSPPKSAAHCAGHGARLAAPAGARRPWPQARPWRHDAEIATNHAFHDSRPRSDAGGVGLHPRQTATNRDRTVANAPDSASARSPASSLISLLPRQASAAV